MHIDIPASTGDSSVFDQKPWLNHYSPGVPPIIDPPTGSIWDVLEDIATRRGDLTAFVFKDYYLTYKQLRSYADQMSRALAGAGVKKGDSVLLLLPNVPHFPITYYGALRLGAMLASAPPTSVERELEYFVRDSGAKTIITLDLLFDKVQPMWRRCGIDTVIVGSVTDFMPVWVRIASPYMQRIPKPKIGIEYNDHVVPMRQLLSRAPRIRVTTEVGPHDVALLQYTGGTTGTPKAAMLTHGNLLCNAAQMRVWFPSLEEGKETILAVLPFFHVYGVTLVMNAGLLLAARTVLIAGGWVPSEVFEAIKRYKVTVFPGVPTLYVAMLNDRRSREYDLSSIDICACGGAPLPLEVKREFERLTQGHLLEAYGLSEASPLTHAEPSTESPKAGSVGIPVPSTEARIIDASTGLPLSVGQDGELVVRGPQIMAGYWNREDETADVLHDGWLRTGDIAHMDADGYFFIVDRKKDLIITGGENVYPREIEEVLFEHPAIKEAAVVGIPHRYGGEIAKAFIVLKPGEQATKQDIIKFTSQRLAKHKVPRALEFRDELPKSSSGKTLRRVLGEQDRARRESQMREARTPEPTGESEDP